MPNPEREYLRLSQDETQISLNPKMFSEHALRRILKLQIGAPSEIKLRLLDGRRLIYSEETLRNARRLPKEKRRRFIDLTLKEILNSDELTIKGKASQQKPYKSPAPPYDNVFRTFIENDLLLRVWCKTPIRLIYQCQRA